MSAITGCVFLVFCFIYCLLTIESKLIYHAFGRLIEQQRFEMGHRFLAESLSYCGGMVEYVTRLLSELYYYPLIGSAVITAIGLFFFAGTYAIVRRTVLSRLPFLCCLPAVAILVIYGRYYHPLADVIGLLLAVIFFVIYVRLTEKKSLIAIVVFLVLFFTLYYIATDVCLIFALFAGIHDLLARKRWVAGTAILLFTVGSFFVGAYVLDIDIRLIHWQLMRRQRDISDFVKYWMYGLYAFVALLVVLAGILTRIGATAKNKSMKQPKKAAAPNARPLLWTLGLAGNLIVLAIICITCTYPNLMHRKKQLLKTGSLADSQQWAQLLKEAKKGNITSNSALEIYDINRALYYTGVFGDQMFNYPQNTESLLLNMENNDVFAEIYFRRTEQMFELGYVGVAEKFTYEMLENIGSHPQILKMLAMINIVKEDMATAKTYLGALSKDVINGSYADDLLAKVAGDPNLDADKEITRLRSCAITEDNLSFNFAPDKFFGQLLQKNPANRMAFEYMMAYYLLNRQVDKIAANIWRLKELGYEEMPLSYEEALLIYVNAGGKVAGADDFAPKPVNITQAKTFYQTLRKFNNNKPLAQKNMATEFGNSYFYYYAFKISGINSNGASRQ